MPFTYFVVVGGNDAAIFELSTQGDSRDTRLQLRQFIAHAALDAVDDAIWTTPSFYLRCVDKFEDYYISAYVSYGPLKLLLMQDTEPYDVARVFLAEANELCAKYIANPFADPALPITSKAFATRMAALFSKYF